jgi:hypothetical protein
MATTAVDPVFVDTNVLVYSTRPLSTHHAAAAGALARLGGAGSTLWISSQILRELSRSGNAAPGHGSRTADGNRDQRCSSVSDGVPRCGRAGKRARPPDRNPFCPSRRRAPSPRCQYRRDDARLQSAPIAHVQRHGFPAFRAADRDRSAAVRAAAPRRQRTSFSGWLCRSSSSSTYSSRLLSEA